MRDNVTAGHAPSTFRWKVRSARSGCNAGAPSFDYRIYPSFQYRQVPPGHSTPAALGREAGKRHSQARGSGSLLSLIVVVIATQCCWAKNGTPGAPPTPRCPVAPSSSVAPALT